MMIGRVDEVDGHFVATRFVALVIPTECLYVTPKSGRPNRSEGVRIRTDWRSVGLGYARVWLPCLAILLPIVIGSSARVPAVVWVLSVAMLLGSFAAQGAGRLPEKEKTRLRLLGTITGLRIDPSKLQQSTREIKRDSLGELMDKGGIPLTPDGILSVLEEIPMPAMPLVYAYVCYAGDDTAWSDCAALVYQRYEQGDI